MKAIHVMPPDEAEEHETSENCTCSPEDFETKRKVWFHKSLHGKEYFVIKQEKWSRGPKGFPTLDLSP